MSDETKDRILETAIDLFWQNGFHGVNMNDLSRAAGVNKATVYQHFSSKEELAVAAVALVAERTETHVYDTAFAASDDPLAWLGGIYDNAFDMHAGICRGEGQCRGCPFVNIGAEMATASAPIRDAVNRAFTGLRRYYERIVDALPRDERRPARDDVVSALLANMHSSLFLSRIENRAEAILEGKERALRIVGA